MPEVHRQFDTNTDNAPIISVVQQSVFVNYLPASVDGSAVEGHGPGTHASPVTANGSNTVFIEYIPINRRDDADNCGHTRAIGSPDVFVDDDTEGVFDNATVAAAGTQNVEGRIVYENTTRGIAALIKEEKKVSPNLPTYHEDTPTEPQEAPLPVATPPEGCKNSKYFTLADSKMAIVAQNGYTKEQIECNWIGLCTAILDPLRDAGFNFKISSGFRTLAYNKSIGSSNSSDHTIGCAVDITLGSQDANKLLFKAILNKMPYTQLIFEGNWVHVGYGGRGPKGPAKVMFTYTGRNPVVAGISGENLPRELRTA
jgi:zinc D-Ala-D-Ala carboxypeptidase